MAGEFRQVAKSFPQDLVQFVGGDFRVKVYQTVPGTCHATDVDVSAGLSPAPVVRREQRRHVHVAVRSCGLRRHRTEEVQSEETVVACNPGQTFPVDPSHAASPPDASHAFILPQHGVAANRHLATVPATCRTGAE
ncbi:hypothetical protein caldi_07920 [Caldinitratiruptor microaerophilus]|uniref:Uncharacterized protein n=1 Tax=Caldinitratiruptor microaerophilus TaxID=671077 RepID=A0AA35CII6_9FIRM|nr:hypothetical protein caldi_07920 [Caldinitratiruptor microaerophilus]